MFGSKEELKKLVEEKDEEIKKVKSYNTRYAKKVEELEKEISILRDAKAIIEKEFKQKEEHATSLLQLQKEREIFEAVNKIKEEYSDKEKQLIEGNFEKLSASMTKIHEEGNRNSKYQEKMAFKMMDAISAIASGSRVNPLQIESPVIEGAENDNNED